MVDRERMILAAWRDTENAYRDELAKYTVGWWVDADKPTARVYAGSYNFSQPADMDNGENLLRIRDRRIAVSYMVEAVRIFDHYEFRAKQQTSSAARKALGLRRPPRNGRELPWWHDAYTNDQRARDRHMFA